MIDAELDDAEFRALATLESLADREGRCTVPNGEAADRCGWSRSKYKRVLGSLEAKGRVRREVEVVGGEHRRAAIVIDRDRGGPFLAREGGPGLDRRGRHWVEDVRRRVLDLLESVEGGATAARIQQVAKQVQAELAGSHQGNPSSLFLSLVEAVSAGYDFAIVGAAIDRVGAETCPACRTDIRRVVYHLTPDPRDYLQAQGMTQWPSRASTYRA